MIPPIWQGGKPLGLVQPIACRRKMRATSANQRARKAVLANPIYFLCEITHFLRG
jgi:hypothetical protein